MILETNRQDFTSTDLIKQHYLLEFHCCLFLVGLDPSHSASQQPPPQTCRQEGCGWPDHYSGSSAWPWGERHSCELKKEKSRSWDCSISWHMLQFSRIRVGLEVFMNKLRLAFCPHFPTKAACVFPFLLEMGSPCPIAEENCGCLLHVRDAAFLQISTFFSEQA